MNRFRPKWKKTGGGEREVPSVNVFLIALSLAAVGFVCIVIYVLLEPVLFGEDKPEYQIVPYASETPVALLPTGTFGAQPTPIVQPPNTPQSTPVAAVPVSASTVSGLAAVGQLAGVSAEVSSVAFSPDGSLLAAGSLDGSVRVWNMATRAIVYTFASASNRVSSVAFSPDGSRLIAGGQDNLVRQWDVINGVELAPLRGPTGAVNDVAFSPTASLVAAASDDGRVYLWDLASSPDTVLATLVGHTSFVTSVTFSPEGTRVAAGSADRSVRVWSVPDGAPVATLTGHTSNVTGVFFSPDGQILASTSYDHTVRLWNIPLQAVSTILTGHTENVNAAAFSPDGSLLVSGSGGIEDNTVRMWDTLSGSQLRTPLYPGGPVNALAFSPDGRLMATGGATFVILWGTTGSGVVSAPPNVPQNQAGGFDAGAATLAPLATSAPAAAGSNEICVLTVRAETADVYAAPDENATLSSRLTLGQQVQANTWTTGSDGFTWWRLSNGAWVRGDAFILTANDTLPDACWALLPVSVDTSGAVQPTAAPTLPNLVTTPGATVCTLTGLLDEINLRAGPGLGYDQVGQLAINQQVQANGWAFGPEGYVWWRLVTGQWVRSDVVAWPQVCQTLPQVQ